MTVSKVLEHEMPYRGWSHDQRNCGYKISREPQKDRKSRYSLYTGCGVMVTRVPWEDESRFKSGTLYQNKKLSSEYKAILIMPHVQII